MEKCDQIYIPVIIGSVRVNNYTKMAATIVVDEVNKTPGFVSEIIEPSTLNLPFPGTDPNAPGAKTLQQKVSSAAAVVLATPEYHGGFSSVIKLVIENLGFPSALKAKPVGLLGVAAGSIGAIKSLEALRGIVSHVGAIPLPLPISIANVQQVFDTQGNILDAQAEKQLRAVATNLIGYLERHVCPAVTLERLLREGTASLPSAEPSHRP